MFKKIKKEGKINKYQKMAEKVIQMDEHYSKMTDEELNQQTQIFRDRLNNGEKLKDIMIEAFAVAREASFRILEKKHYPVQIIGGFALHEGYVAEMKTGEGKTLTEILPAYLNALNGKVHIITVNDYLAERDSDEMGKVFSFLGITSGCINSEMHPTMKKSIYNRDIIYGTSKEFGFDYLRDNMAKSKEEQVMSGLNYVIIDEVDSILIDESRTPLIISSGGDDPTTLYSVIDDFVKNLERGEDIKESDSYYDKMLDDMEYFERDEEGDFRVDIKRKNVIITENGINKIENHFNLDQMETRTVFLINHIINQALKANYTMEKNVDYIVNGKDEVLIVDAFTGRTMPGRRFSDGLHQCIEAKEGVEINKESQTVATITLQNFFSLYNKIAGMTGTALTEENEFIKTYNLKVLPIPTNKPVIRNDRKDVVFITEDDKFQAIANKVKNSNGQPVLIGTPSIDKSEKLSEVFKEFEIPHKVLNAKNHKFEASLIAQAGKKNAVTIATNMAGRGTDIMLGGNPESLAVDEMRKQGFDGKDILFATGIQEPDSVNEREARKAFITLKKEFEEKVKPEKAKVLELGGLMVIGTEKHETRRIDNQLRGRSGRQGDPGETVFMISLEDEIFEVFGGSKISELMKDTVKRDDDYFQNGIKVNRAIKKFIENAQTKNEEHNYNIRKNVLEYDDVVHEQRNYIYKLRQEILDLESNKPTKIYDTMIKSSAKEIMQMIKNIAVNKKQIHEQVNFIIDVVGINMEHVNEKTSIKQMEKDLNDNIIEMYHQTIKKAEESGAKEGAFQRYILLTIIDNLWIQYISDIDNLRNSVSMASFSRTTPVDAFKKESSNLFNNMISSISIESANMLYSLQIN